MYFKITLLNLEQDFSILNLEFSYNFYFKNKYELK